MQALAGCLAIWDFAVNGITNKSLRAWMTGLRGVPYSMNQASYDLARLRRNGLIERIARSNTYRLTPDGLTFALVYSRVHDQILYPLTAHDQPIAAPAPIRAAWRAITRHIDSTIADAHLGRAALAHELALACDQHQLKTQDKRQSPRALEALVRHHSRPERPGRPRLAPRARSTATMIVAPGRRVLGATEQPPGAAPMSPRQAETDTLNGGSERVSSPVASRSPAGTSGQPA